MNLYLTSKLRLAPIISIFNNPWLDTPTAERGQTPHTYFAYFLSKQLSKSAYDDSNLFYMPLGSNLGGSKIWGQIWPHFGLPKVKQPLIASGLFPCWIGDPWVYSMYCEQWKDHKKNPRLITSEDKKKASNKLSYNRAKLHVIHSR